MLNNLNSERIMEAREIYHVLKSIIEPIHAHNDQMVAIAKWIEAEFEYKPHKQANGAEQSSSNCNIPLVVFSEAELKAKLDEQKEEHRQWLEDEGYELLAERL